MEFVKTHRRKQLTLFVSDYNETIEKIREEFNPDQYQLIAAHVTLCREDELENLDEVMVRLKSIKFKKPLRICFDTVETYNKGKGLMIPANENNECFLNLRKLILGTELIKQQKAHITLMHPRNSSCNPELFDRIKNVYLPNELLFSTISLIEQVNGGIWKTLKEFNIVE